MRSINSLYSAIPTVIFLGLCLTFSVTSYAEERQIERIVVFGTSLSDSGNVFALLSDPAAYGFGEDCEIETLINMPSLVSRENFQASDGSYAKAINSLTNGATWIEQLARGRGLYDNARPALAQNSDGINASNYAVAGARATDVDCRFNLRNQVIAYLNDFPLTSAKTLFVIEMGSNDVRDALDGLAQGQDPEIIIGTALANIGEAIKVLYDQGARKFLLANVPAVGEVPAIKILDRLFPGAAATANSLTAAFNAGLLDVKNNLSLFLSDINLRLLDPNLVLNEIIENPAAFGIVNTKDACVTTNTPLFQCEKPDSYLFWDEFHPTEVAHGIVAQKAIEALLTTAQ